MTRNVSACALLLGSIVTSACSSSATTQRARPVIAAPPPKDDGTASTSRGGNSQSAHAAALEQLKLGRILRANDKQNSVRIPLPDAEHWTRVTFWGVPSLVGFRYGKDHHAIVGAFVLHVPDNSVEGACEKSFQAWGEPWLKAFDVEVHHDPPAAVMWHRQIVEIDSVMARTATLTSRESYAAAYASYPAWPGACLVVGIAIPSRDEEERAREVRDRFAQEALRRVEVLSKTEPKDPN